LPASELDVNLCVLSPAWPGFRLCRTAQQRSRQGEEMPGRPRGYLVFAAPCRRALLGLAPGPANSLAVFSMACRAKEGSALVWQAIVSMALGTGLTAKHERHHHRPKGASCVWIQEGRGLAGPLRRWPREPSLRAVVLHVTVSRFGMCRHGFWATLVTPKRAR
jgi:hypothetical protein